MDKGDDFTREVLERTVDAVNAGALGPHVTAPDDDRVRAFDAVAEAVLQHTIEVIRAKGPEAIPADHPEWERELREKHMPTVRADLMAWAKSDDSIEFIRAELVELKFPPNVVDTICYWVGVERGAGSTTPATAVTTSGDATPSDAPLEPIEEDDAPAADDDAAVRLKYKDVLDIIEEHDRNIAAIEKRYGRKGRYLGHEEGTGPYASASEMLCALKVARRAAPKKDTDDPAVAFVVVGSDPDRRRVLFSARDGRRWHVAFVDTSEPVFFRTMQIALEKARELADMLEFAAGRYAQANVRFRSSTGSDLIWHIAYGETERFEIELAPGIVTPDGWAPPRFEFAAPAVAALTTYDARAIAQATSWPGGAIVSRDEADLAGLRHLTLTDLQGKELLRAVIVPFGQTAGLPADRQTEIDGTLSPPRTKPIEPGTPAGPATIAPDDAKWRLERRNASGEGWHTLRSGTEAECSDVEFLKRSQDGGASLRIVRPDGVVDKEIEPSTKGSKAEAKRVGGPGKKSKAQPIVHRGKKPGKAADKPAKTKAPKRSRTESQKKGR